MSPVHVIVGDDARAERMWAQAFTGAVDLYRFERNADAFERLVAAQAPVDLVVLTPAQRGPFNLTPDQFLARIFEGTLASSPALANLHVIVVGSPVRMQHPRVMSVSTLAAAVRLVKFGEVEAAPMPAAQREPAPAPAPPQRDERTGREQMRPAAADAAYAPRDTFAGSVISRIWAAADDEPAVAAPQQPAVDPVQPPARVDVDDSRVRGGGGRSGPAPATGFADDTAEPRTAAVAAQHGSLFARGVRVAMPAQVTGGGAPGAMDTRSSGETRALGAPGEAIEVASGHGLQPARPYQLPGGGTYRGGVMRSGAMMASSHEVQRPMPPAAAAQVHAMVYGPAGTPVADPMMMWTSSSRAGAPAAAPAPVAASVQAVPMNPPTGAYGAQPAAAAAAPAADPLLQRLGDGGGVSFG